MPRKAFRSDGEEYATYELALALRMTVGELRQRMSGSEFLRWQVFFTEKYRREERAHRRAGRRRQATSQAHGGRGA